MTTAIVTPDEAAKRINLPLEMWEGNCHSVASAMVDCDVFRGAVVYGHYRGPINDTSSFAKYKPLGFCRHGWIVTSSGVVTPGKRIVDPTRWCFDAPGTKPFIYETSPSDADYDEGGNVWRERCRRPCPDRDMEPTKPVELVFADDDTKDAVSALLNPRNSL